jgi:hypothetical protein
MHTKLDFVPMAVLTPAFHCSPACWQFDCDSKPGVESIDDPYPVDNVSINIHVPISVLPIDLGSLYGSHFSICYNA